MKKSFLLLGTIIISIFVLSFTACPPVDDTLDYMALNEAIARAEAAKDEIAISEDGSDVNPMSKWVTQEVLDILNDAIDEAKAVKSQAAATQTEVDTAASTLNSAVTAFDNEKQDGTKPLNVNDLQDILDDANTLKGTAVVSTDGSDVNITNFWVTQEEMDALDDAISSAGDAIESGENLDSAYIELNDAISVFTMAKKPGTQGAADPELPVTVKLTVEIFDRGTSDGRTLAHNNAWTNWIKEKVKKDLNIDIEFVPIGRWTENQDIADLMASSSAPDLCYTYEMGANFSLTNLAPYIDSHLPDLKILLGIDPVFTDRGFIYRNRDTLTGAIYSIPSYRIATAQRNIFIRKDWLDTLGIPVPTTFKQLEEALIAFRDNDPGKVGADNVIPFGVDINARWGLANMIHHFIDPDMSVRDRWVYSIADRNIYMPGYIEGVRKMNEWYNGGLLYHNFPMINANDFESLIKSGVVGAFCQDWDFPYRSDFNIIADLRKNVPNADYVPIDVTRNKEMHDKVGLQVFIPEFSQNKDAALRYLNWLAIPENYNFLQLGQLGVNHQIVDGWPRPIAATGEWIMNSQNNIDYTMSMNGIEMGNPEGNLAVNMVRPGFTPAVIAHAYETSVRNAHALVVHNVTTQVNQYNSDLRGRVDTLLVQAITGSSADFDSIWNTGIAEWLAAGAQEVLTERESLYPH